MKMALQASILIFCSCLWTNGGEAQLGKPAIVILKKGIKEVFILELTPTAMKFVDPKYPKIAQFLPKEDVFGFCYLDAEENLDDISRNTKRLAHVLKILNERHDSVHAEKVVTLLRLLESMAGSEQATQSERQGAKLGLVVLTDAVLQVNIIRQTEAEVEYSTLEFPMVKKRLPLAKVQLSCFLQSSDCLADNTAQRERMAKVLPVLKERGNEELAKRLDRSIAELTAAEKRDIEMKAMLEERKKQGYRKPMFEFCLAEEGIEVPIVPTIRVAMPMAGGNGGITFYSPIGKTDGHTLVVIGENMGLASGYAPGSKEHYGYMRTAVCIAAAAELVPLAKELILWMDEFYLLGLREIPDDTDPATREERIAQAVAEMAKSKTLRRSYKVETEKQDWYSMVELIQVRLEGGNKESAAALADITKTLFSTVPEGEEKTWNELLHNISALDIDELGAYKVLVPLFNNLIAQKNYQAAQKACALFISKYSTQKSILHKNVNRLVLEADAYLKHPKLMQFVPYWKKQGWKVLFLDTGVIVGPPAGANGIYDLHNYYWYEIDKQLKLVPQN